MAIEKVILKPKLTKRDKVIKKILKILSEDWDKEGTKEFVLEDMLEEYFYYEFTQKDLDEMLETMQEERGGE